MSDVNEGVLHPEVSKKMRVCDRLYEDKHGRLDHDLKACLTCIKQGVKLNPDKLDRVCSMYCRRWTFPF